MKIKALHIASVLVGLGLVLAGFFFNPKRSLVRMESAQQASNFEREPSSQFNQVPRYQGAPVAKDMMSSRKEVDELNRFIVEMKPYGSEDTHGSETSHESVVNAANQIISYSKTHPNSFAAAYYAAFAKLVEPSKALLWRLGGIVGLSEHIYVAVVSGLKSFANNGHLYSKTVKRMFDFYTIPDSTSKRFSSVSEFQDWLTETFLPLVEKSLADLETLHAQTEKSGFFEFLYDRTLVASGKSSEFSQDRWSRFVRPYLSATIFYGKTFSGIGYAFASYNLDDVPRFLNAVLWRQVVSSKVRMLDISKWNQARYNVTINSTESYVEEARRFPELFTLREKKDFRRKSLAMLQEGQNYNLEYIGQMREYAKLPQQNEFIVDARELLNKPDQDPLRYEKLARAISGPETYTEPLTGKKVTMDFTALFRLKEKDLKYYLPTSCVPGDEKIYVLGKKEQYFNYKKGRALTWNDTSFGGFLTGVSDVYEAHRILTYSEDGAGLGNTILPFVM